ncbi:MAG TPA: ABC transporter substrate-binding protein [Methylomirabilota bacterium]|nr:ABC transporter substrate-binding protein [Methylomirabilota bacterium]
MANEGAIGRRTLLAGAGAATGAALLGVPRVLRAQAKEIKIGAVHPVTGALAEIGQACRLGAQMAADAVNAAGGIKSLGGAKLVLLPGDTQNSPDVARSEAERLINDGAVMLTGAFHSGQTAAIAPVAQQRRIPFLIDISAADPITLNVAQSVKEGKQKVQYVYRNFPTTAVFGRKAVEFMGAMFKEAGVAPKRVVLVYTNDLFGQTQAKQFQAAQKAMNPGFEIVEAIPFAENATDLSTEVSRAKALKPDIIAPVVRAITAVLLLQEIAKQRLDLMGIISPGTPGLYEKGQIEQLGKLIEHVMDIVPWPNYKNARTQQVADEYGKRSGGKTFDTNSGYSYEAILVMADVLERAKSTDPDTIVQAIKATSFANPLMVAAGPIRFNEVGDNPNASTAVIQILGAKPLVVYPRESAQAKLVFPVPKI